MKKFAIVGMIFLGLFLLNCSETSQEETKVTTDEVAETKVENSGLEWTVNIEEAVAKAKAENKIVMVNFTGSDWCKWCVKLDGEVFSKSEFAAYAKENLVLVKMDFPKAIKQSEETIAYNKTQAQKFEIRGYPTIIVLDGEGKVIGNTGYKEGGPVTYVEHLEAFRG